MRAGQKGSKAAQSSCNKDDNQPDEDDIDVGLKMKWLLPIMKCQVSSKKTCKGCLTFN